LGLEDVGANNFRVVLQAGQGVLQVVGHHHLAVLAWVEAVQPRPFLTDLPSVDCHLAVLEAFAVGHHHQWPLLVTWTARMTIQSAREKVSLRVWTSEDQSCCYCLHHDH